MSPGWEMCSPSSVPEYQAASRNTKQRPGIPSICCSVFEESVCERQVCLLRCQQQEAVGKPLKRLKWERERLTRVFTSAYSCQEQWSDNQRDQGDEGGEEK